jgi:PAS domain S-box-containing protein
MDIRTKLVFALVAVALGSMIALGGFMYWFTNRQLKESRLEQLDGLAAAMKEGMEQIASGWEDRVRLIASRTQLREILRDGNPSENARDKARIGRILADAQASVPTVAALAVYDTRGEFIASAGWGTETDIPLHLTAIPHAGDGVVYERVLAPEHEELRVAYSAPLTSDGTRRGDLVGVLQVRLDAAPLVRLTRNREGLGLTGETLVAIRDVDGAVRVLTPFRLGTPPEWYEVQLRGESDPVALAMAGQEGSYSNDLSDPGGEPVWAAIRYLEEMDWGLILKIDASEAKAPAEAYRKYLTDVVISLAALAILIGTIMGLRFAKPIHELSAAADRIRGGDLSVRAPTNSQDEVGLLARNFNQMAEELEQQVTLLREFQNYFDYSLDMLCIAGYDGFFKRVNPAFQRTLGWTTEELLSRKFLDFVHPDDLPKTEEEIENLARGQPTISFENRYMCFDGSEKILAWTAHPEPETGMIYAIARDVTDLRAEQDRAAEKIRHLQRRLEEAEAKRRGEP